MRKTFSVASLVSIVLFGACQAVARPLPAPPPVAVPAPPPALQPAAALNIGVERTVPTAPLLTLRHGEREWSMASAAESQALLDRVGQDVDREPVAARLDFVGGDPRPAVDGARLERDAAAKLIARALENGERVVELPVVTLPAGPATTVPAKGKRTVMYHVPGDPESWRSLDANWDATDYVAAQWVDVNACGGLTTRDDQTLNAVARARGVGVLPSLLTYSGTINHRLLANPAVSENLIHSIVGYVVAEDYAGFDIDLEAIEPSDRELFNVFIAELAGELHARGKILAMAVPPKEREMKTGQAAAYDYAELGRHADIITLMTYDYAGSWGDSGPVAPHEPVRRAVAYAASLIPPEKLSIGLAFYGYDWNETTGQVRAIGHERARDLSARYEAPITLDAGSRSATLSYSAPAGESYRRLPDAPTVNHRVTTRKAEPCAEKFPGKPAPPPGSSTGPKPAPPPSGPQQHRVWIEDARSNAARLEIAERYGTGVAGWRLGLEDPALWQALRDWRSSAPGTYGMLLPTA